MKLIARILILAVALVTGLTVSAQTVQVLVIQKVPTLPSTASNYLDDPFRYFNVQFVVTGAPSDGLDVFFDMEFSLNDGSFYLRTRPGSVPSESIHLSEGVNIMKRDDMLPQIQGRKETNVDTSKPLNAQKLPEGTYQLCVDIYLWSDRTNPARVPISDGICPTYDICYSGSAPELVSPLAGAQMALNGTMVVTPSRKINFFWTPVISNCADNTTRFKYRLKVVKVLEGQNYRDAIKYNPTVFSTEVRNNTHAVFDTLRDIKVQMERGALYVAQVQAEQIKNKKSMETFEIANDGNSQPMPFFWAYYDSSRDYVFSVEEDDEEGDISEGVDGLTHWKGGVEEESELESIIEEAFADEQTVILDPQRYIVESDGYYTIPMAENIEVGIKPAQHKSLKDVTYALELYDYMEGGIDSITSYEPLYTENIGELPESQAVIGRTLAGWGSELQQGNLYYMQLTSSFTVGYWKYDVADTVYYVNGMLAEHIHDTVSREFVEEAMEYSDGVFFQWGDDPDDPDFLASQWKAPVDRSGDDIYDRLNYHLSNNVPQVQKAKTFPVSWTPFQDVVEGDHVEYTVNVYELKLGQTILEAVSENKVLVSRTVTDVNEISEKDTKFFKVFSPEKTYVMTLSTDVTSEENAYHFRNGNEAIPIVFEIVK